MNALVDELAARAGMDDAFAENTIGIMQGYLRSEGPPRLMGPGLAITDIQNIARELFASGRDKTGADRMHAIIAGTPEPGHFA